MAAENKNNSIFPVLFKNLVRLFGQFGKKVKLSETNSRKLLGTKQSDWAEILK